MQSSSVSSTLNTENSHLNFLAMDVTAAAGETTDDDNVPSSSNESENSEISIEDGEIIESEEEVDIVNVSDEETAAEGGKGKIVNTEIEQEATRSQEIEIGKQKVVYTKESASSSAVIVEDRESSESSVDEETEPQMFENLPSNFPYRFAKLIKDPSSIHPRILMEKRLRRADVRKSKDRLSITRKWIKESFLTEEEKKKLESGEVMGVAVMEPDGETVSYLRLRKLRNKGKEMGSYALTGGWYNTVARNSDALMRGEFVRVWYFRVNGRLWFGVEVVGEVKRQFEILEQMSQKWCHENILVP